MSSLSFSPGLSVSFYRLRPEPELAEGMKAARATREQQAACRLFSPDCVRVEHHVYERKINEQGYHNVEYIIFKAICIMRKTADQI